MAREFDPIAAGGKLVTNEFDPLKMGGVLRQQQAQQTEQDMDRSFLSKLLPNLLAGLATGGQNTLNLPSNIAKSSEEYAQKRGVKDNLATMLKLKSSDIPRFGDNDYSKMLNIPGTTADKIVQALAQYAPGLVSPGADIGAAGKLISKVPYAGKAAAKVVSNAIPIGAFSATQSEHPLEAAESGAAGSAPMSALSAVLASSNPVLKILARLGAGGLGAYTGHQAAQAIAPGSEIADVGATTAGGALGMFGLSPSTEARENILKGTTPEAVQEKLAASKRLGLSYLTPAEASGNPFVAAQQGAAGKTEGGSQLLYGKGQERLESEKKSIDNLYQSIFDKEKLSPEVDKLYKASYQASIPDQALNKLKKNQVIKQAMKDVTKSPAYKEELKDVPKNSIGYLDIVKQALDDMEEKAPQKKARIIKRHRNNLLEQMDSVSPEYKQARGLAEREIVRKKLEDSLNEANVRGTSFFNANLKNDKRYEKLLFSLRNVPDAQEKLKDMKLVFSDLINPPTVRTAAGLAKTGMTQERNSKLAMYNYLKDKLSNGKYDKAAITLMTSPTWDQELAKIISEKNKVPRVAKMADLLSKISGTMTSDYENNQNMGK